MRVKLAILGVAGVALLAWQGMTSPSSPLHSAIASIAGQSGNAVASASAKAKPGNYAVASQSVSSNWSGYVVNEGPYAGVSASWKVPTLSQSQGGVVAEWVGIGGTGQSEALLQCGVLQQWSDGNSVTQAFTESLPASAKPGKTVPAGATVTASVTPSGQNRWTLTVRSGSTTLASQTVTLTADEAQMVEQSAEWITEAPSTGRGRIEPLATFTPVTFQNATVLTPAGKTESMAVAGTPAPVVLASMDGLQAQPGAIGAGGATFTVTESQGTAQSPYGGSYPYGYGYGGYGSGGYGRGYGGSWGYGGYGYGGFGGYGYGGYSRHGSWGW